LRSAEAFGVQRVEVTESSPAVPLFVDVTQGCEKWLDIARHATQTAAVAALRRDGFAIYAAAPAAVATIDDLDLTRRRRSWSATSSWACRPKRRRAPD